MALKIQFSAGDIEGEIGARATQGRESVVAKRDLGRYYSVLRRSLPTFTIGEARVIVRAVTEAAAPTYDQGPAFPRAGGSDPIPPLLSGVYSLLVRYAPCATPALSYQGTDRDRPLLGK